MDLGTILYDVWHLCGAQQRCQFSYLWAGGTHRYELSHGNENKISVCTASEDVSKTSVSLLPLFER